MTSLERAVFNILSESTNSGDWDANLETIGFVVDMEVRELPENHRLVRHIQSGVKILIKFEVSTY